MPSIIRETAQELLLKIKLIGSMILLGDAYHVLGRIPREFIQCVVTSPPYWGLRDYKIEGQIGLEESLQQYINRLISIFREVN